MAVIQDVCKVHCIVLGQGKYTEY